MMKPLVKSKSTKLKAVASNDDPGPNSAWIVIAAGDLDGDGRDEVVGIRDADDGFFVYKYDGEEPMDVFIHVLSFTGFTIAPTKPARTVARKLGQLTLPMGRQPKHPALCGATLWTASEYGCLATFA